MLAGVKAGKISRSIVSVIRNKERVSVVETRDGAVFVEAFEWKKRGACCEK